MNRKHNICFVDGQNFYLGVTESSWKVDLYKFRVYLKDKYHVQEAYYFFGFIMEEQQDLYNQLQKAGFIVVFKEHSSNLLAQKKGNVDTDIVFEIMKNLIDNKDFNKIVLVSGDGDYKKVVDYLIAKNRFEKILFPNKKFASSLYKKLGSEFYSQIEGIRSYIEYRNEKGS